MNKTDKLLLVCICALAIGSGFLGYFLKWYKDVREAKKRPIHYEVQVEETPQKGELLQVLDITKDTVWIGYPDFHDTTAAPSGG